jgi:membrane protein implicated in regulation of membrane protease activity
VAWIIWLCVAIVLGIAEIFSLTFVLLMFAGGAVAASLTAAVGAPIAIQAAVFVVVSALALVGVRPYTRKLRDSRTGPDADIGLQALDGAAAVVLERVDKQHGLIKVHGQEWTARALDAEQSFEPGDEVNIVEIRGATAIVWRQS